VVAIVRFKKEAAKTGLPKVPEGRPTLGGIKSKIFKLKVCQIIGSETIVPDIPIYNNKRRTFRSVLKVVAVARNTMR